MMKSLLLALLLAGISLHAQPVTWQPSPGHKQIELWPGRVPDAPPITGPETVGRVGKPDLVAGQSWTWVGNVTRPTITVYSPKSKKSGTAVIVMPGGGYVGLAIDLEGSEVCEWLNTQGITCVLLKYRVPGTPTKRYPKTGAYPQSPMALEDTQRAVSVVRYRAKEWGLDPHKIGVLGFSAGGHLAAAVANHFNRRLYAPVDAADKESSRPDFSVSLYPGHLSLAANSIALNPDIASHITRQTPPTFLLQNEDDHVDRVEDSVSYYMALKKAGVPVEMHLYAQGGHAFGMRPTKFPATHWPHLVKTWLQTIGMIAE